MRNGQNGSEMTKTSAKSTKQIGAAGSDWTARLSLWPSTALADRAADALAARFGAENIPRATLTGNWFQYANRRVDATGNLWRAARGQVDYLWLPSTGNFGNNLIQISNALVFAKAEGIPRIFHPFRWLGDHDRFRHGTPRLLSSKAGLRNGFFAEHMFTSLKSAEPAATLALLDSELVPALKWLPVPPEQSAITVSLRAGDVMWNRQRQNGNYVQPPLSFYTGAIRRLMDQTGRQEIEIITTDYANPAFFALEVWADQQGITVRFNPDRSVRTDITRLLAAEHLVTGYTSFSAALASVSQNLKSYAYFRTTHRLALLQTRLALVLKGSDVAGDYIAPGTWKNTIAQRRMIVDYPEKDLGFEALPRPDTIA